MNKKYLLIFSIFLFVIALNLISSITLIAGENYTFESEKFEYYTVIGNSSNTDGMNITWENGNTTISFDERFNTDSFSIVFFNESEEIITKYVYEEGETIYKTETITETEVVEKEVVKYVQINDSSVYSSSEEGNLEEGISDTNLNEGFKGWWNNLQRWLKYLVVFLLLCIIVLLGNYLIKYLKKRKGIKGENQKEQEEIEDEVLKKRRAKEAIERILKEEKIKN